MTDQTPIPQVLLTPVKQTPIYCRMFVDGFDSDHYHETSEVRYMEMDLSKTKTCSTCHQTKNMDAFKDQQNNCITCHESILKNINNLSLSHYTSFLFKQYHVSDDENIPKEEPAIISPPQLSVAIGTSQLETPSNNFKSQTNLQTNTIPSDSVDPTKRSCKTCFIVKPINEFEPRRKICLACRNKRKVASAHAKVIRKLLTDPNPMAPPEGIDAKEAIHFEYPKPHRGILPIECKECHKPFNLETCTIFRYRVDVCKYRSQCHDCYNIKQYQNNRAKRIRSFQIIQNTVSTS